MMSRMTPGHDGADKQIREAVLRDDTVNDNDKSAGRSANLDARTAQGGNQKARNDRRKNARLRSRSRGYPEGHGQRQRHNPNRDPRRQIGKEFTPAIILQAIHQLGPKLDIPNHAGTQQVARGDFHSQTGLQTELPRLAIQKYRISPPSRR
jgi:hypothetical protein